MLTVWEAKAVPKAISDDQGKRDFILRKNGRFQLNLRGSEVEIHGDTETVNR